MGIWESTQRNGFSHVGPSEEQFAELGAFGARHGPSSMHFCKADKVKA
jgi:hypothetical protein